MKFRLPNRIWVIVVTLIALSLAAEHSYAYDQLVFTFGRDDFNYIIIDKTVFEMADKLVPADDTHRLEVVSYTTCKDPHRGDFELLHIYKQPYLPVTLAVKDITPASVFFIVWDTLAGAPPLVIHDPMPGDPWDTQALCSIIYQPGWKVNTMLLGVKLPKGYDKAAIKTDPMYQPDDTIPAPTVGQDSLHLYFRGGV